MPEPIRAVVFDVYGTLFDVRSLSERCDTLFPGHGRTLSDLWRSKQLEYAWLRTLMGQYRDFRRVTEDALRFAARRLGLDLSDTGREELLAAYSRLPVFPEVPETLTRLEGVRRAVFSNGPRSSLEPLLDHAGILGLFDDLLSVDAVRTYKPSPRAYDLVLENIRLPKRSVLFVSSNTWDVSGAKNFGFTTAWVDRGVTVMDELGQHPDAVIKDLRGIGELLV